MSGAIPEQVGRSHLSREDLRSLLRTGATSPSATSRLLAHLCYVCSEGARVVERVQQRGADSPVPLGAPDDPDLGQGAYSGSFQRLREALPHWTEAATREEAHPDLTSFLALPHHQALGALTNDSRLQTLAVWQELVELGRDPRRTPPPADPEGVLELAAFAAAKLDPAVYGRALIADSQGVTWLALADLRLRRGQIETAKAALLQAARVASQGSGNPTLLGDVHLRAAILHRMAGQTDASLVELDEALALYAEAEDSQLQAQAHLHKGLSLDLAGRGETARGHLVLGLILFDAHRDPELAAQARAALQRLVNATGTPAESPPDHRREPLPN